MIEIQKGIYEFFNPSIETIMNRFAIVERATITQEEAEELLKILKEWTVQGALTENLSKKS